MKKFYKALAVILAVAMLFCCGCSKKEEQAPVVLTIWHYYNGSQQQTFSDLVSEFNSTYGAENNIVVKAVSKGGFNDVRNSVLQSANQTVGSDELPDIFSAYADNAYELYPEGLLADMAPYFTDEERALYIDDYINEGDFSGNGSIMIFPIGKSTEIIVVNKTDWEPFAAKCSVSEGDLTSWEGIVKVAEKYYEYTDSLTDEPNDGKAFFGIDSIANYMIIGSLQLGTEIFETADGKVKINLDHDIFKKLWDNYYVPFVKGYFTSQGRFRSDDAKTGDLIALLGSTSSAAFFPKEVTREDGTTYPIEAMILTMPVFSGGEKFAAQQGAGMAVIKSDERTERAATEFLKWITQPENNLKFVTGAGYLPVRYDANSIEALDKYKETKASSGNPISDIIYESTTVAIDIVNNSRMYTNGAFENSYELRSVLENSLKETAVRDKAVIDELIASGTDRDEALADFVSEKSFENWFAEFSDKLK